MDKVTINTYNCLWREYQEETKNFWVNFPLLFLDSFAKKINGKVLSVGSGPGDDAVLLRRLGLDVVCVDASREMVRITTQKGFESQVGDFMSLPFAQESFSAVWAYTSLLHVSKSEIAKAISEIYRVLCPGGIFAIGMIEGKGEVYRESSGVSLPRLFSFYSREEIESLLKVGGFNVLDFTCFKPASKTYLSFIAEKMV